MSHIEQNLASRSSSQRIFELDALRGIAACIVVLHHFRFMFNMTPPRWIFRPLFDGDAAVVLFFCLSGFVLSLSYWNGRQLPYPRYLLQRFFRIYVPYAAACIFAVLVGRNLMYNHLPLSPWFHGTWQEPLTFRLVMSQLLEMKTIAAINTAFWSLRYEVEMSIIFPALCFLLEKLRPVGSIALGLACLFLGNFVNYSEPHRDLKDEAMKTVLYASCFILGAVISWKRSQINSIYSKVPKLLKLVFLGMALVGYYSFREQAVILSACLLVIFAQHYPLKRLLRLPIPEYLGEISYSLYLTHATILFASTILLYGKIPTPVLFLIYVTISFAVAHMFFVYVERPAFETGKRLAKRGL